MTRQTFKQQGIVDWRRLPLGLMLQLIPILILGAILAALQVAAFYVVILMPVFAVIVPALLSAWIAAWMKWREPRIAGTVGFVLGAIAYLSQFYLVMVYWNGLPALWRLDQVPLVIINVTNNVQIGDEIDPVKNWMLLLVEMLAGAGMFALAHVQATQNLYCPRCSAALKKKSSILPPHFATALAEGIDEQNMDHLPLDESGGEIEGDAWSAVEVLYCFHGEKGEPLFYLTLRETRFEQGAAAHYLMFDKVLLSADEMIAIGEKCPGLVIGPS
jgi:hypothetical protein